MRNQISLKNIYNALPTLSILIIFLIIFIKKFNFIEIESIDYEIFKIISGENNYKDKLFYDPHYNFNYLVYFLYLILDKNLNYVLPLIWMISEILVLFSFKKIIKRFFSDDNLILLLFFLFYISFRSGEIDQKSFSYPFIYFSIYFFLSRKYFFAFLNLSLIYYFHIGLALWSTIPLFTLFIFTEFERKNYKYLINFSIFFILLISPIIYFYSKELLSSSNSFNDRMFIDYWYGNFSNSIYTYFTNLNDLIKFFLQSFFLLFIYKKFRFENRDLFKKFLILLIGIYFIFFINFIFSDLLQIPSFIKLQLLRGDFLLYFIVLLLSCFFIASEARKKHFLPILIFIIFVIPNLIHFKLNLFQIKYTFILLIFICLIFSNNNFYINLNRFIILLIERLIKIKYEKIYLIIFILFIFQKTASYIFIDQNYKNKLIGNERLVVDHKNTYLKDAIIFVNNNLNDENLIFITPFHETDVKYILKYKVLFSPTFMSDYYIPNIQTFKKIIKDDLNIVASNLYETNWKKKWNELDTSIVNNWIQNYKLTHALVDKKKILPFKKIFENELYVVQDLRIKE